MSECTRKKTFCQVCGYRPCMERPGKGPVQILCEEIGFAFDRRLERSEVLVAFVGQLVGEVASIRDVQASVAELTLKSPSDGSAEALALAQAMLLAPSDQERRAAAEVVHDACHRLNPEDAYPTDHLIDMLSSCASGIRFGLDERDLGISSRHAAAAAQHVWKQKYGVSLFDGNTPAWEKEWARGVLLSAIISLLPPMINAAAPAAHAAQVVPQPREEPLSHPPDQLREEEQ